MARGAPTPLTAFDLVSPEAQRQDDQFMKLDEFLKEAGQKPYRQLVEYHLKKKSVPELQQAAIGETDLLPQQLRPFVMGYIDDLNRQLAYDQEFWSRVTCREAFEAIIEIAVESMPIGDKVASVNEALEPSNHELAFGLFQICTLSFAYSASTQRKQRQFMGIRKGIFG